MAHGAVAEEHSERVDQCMAENLIGLEEAHVDDPGARFAVLQRKLEMLQKETKKLEQKERQSASATQTAAELQVGIEGQREHCKQVALDIRGMAKKIGATHELELERAVSAAGGIQCGETARAPTGRRSDAQGLALQGPAAVLEARAAESEVPPRHCSDAQELVAGGCPGNFEARAEHATGGKASQPAAQPRAQGLKVQAGAALSSFDAQCWPLCFTEFFYGDCARTWSDRFH